MLRREMTEEDRMKKKKVGEKVKEIKNKDLCPSCYNQEFGGLYEDFTDCPRQDSGASADTIPRADSACAAQRIRRAAAGCP